MQSEGREDRRKLTNTMIWNEGSTGSELAALLPRDEPDRLILQVEKQPAACLKPECLKPELKYPEAQVKQ